ncbi:MAG: DUF1569 domain-containing protein [Pirellulales bacterium]|nr:DUF1569 domain-containing protein [Pirellulales bacterium]
MPRIPSRTLTLQSIEELHDEIVRLDEARTRQCLSHSGTWSLDQCCQHLARWIEFSIDGFAFKYPWPFRLLGRIVRFVLWQCLVTLAMRPGFVNPRAARAVEPDAKPNEGEGVADLLRQLARLENGTRMEQPSPVEGPLSQTSGATFICVMPSCI